jgi:hypothetical protein
MWRAIETRYKLIPIFLGTPNSKRGTDISLLCYSRKLRLLN